MKNINPFSRSLIGSCLILLLAISGQAWAQQTGDSPFYRMYLPSGEHFYSISLTESQGVVNGGAEYEGVAGMVFSYQAPGTVPLYRLYANGKHHFTISYAELQGCVAAGWKYEGVACYVYPSQNSQSVPLYRLSGYGEHFFTISQGERQFCLKNGWTDEGIACFVSSPPAYNKPVFRLLFSNLKHFHTLWIDEVESCLQDGIVEGISYFAYEWPIPGTVPFYRLYANGDHHFTISYAEVQRCVAAGWKYEGVACYVYPSQTSQSVPLYRLSGYGEHFFTINQAERQNCLNGGWKDEGIACFVNATCLPTAYPIPPPPRSRLLLAYHWLTPGQSLNSPNGIFTLLMQSDGNLVLYQNKPNGTRTVKWSTKTSGHAVKGLLMQGDGNLVLYDNQSKPLWTSRTGGRGLSRFAVENSGELIVYAVSDGRATWFSGTGYGLFSGEVPIVMYKYYSLTHLEQFSYKPISQVKKGDTVYSFDQNSYEYGGQKVASTFSYRINNYVEVRTSNGYVLKTSPEQLFCTLSGSDLYWVTAGYLKKDAVLLTGPGGKKIKVSSVRLVNSPLDLYGFEVEQTHAFTIGTEKIVVHNGLIANVCVAIQLAIAQCQGVGPSRPVQIGPPPNPPTMPEPKSGTKTGSNGPDPRGSTTAADGSTGSVCNDSDSGACTL